MDVRKYAPDIIFADPPYSEEDMQHYKNEHLVNRPKVVSECAQVLQPGGFLIWLDQVLPVFANAEIRLVGLISYIRSTGNRFRCVCIFQKGNS
jgi:16S rRNA G966 N2-methylase RsmD